MREGVVRVLKPSEKKYFSELIQYFFDTTETSFENYVKLASDLLHDSTNTVAGSSYAAWLLYEIFEMLKARNISPSVCIENKDIARDIALGEQSRNEGEFYTPEIWCKKGREYIQKYLGHIWGNANVWDMACGTGNLMRTAEYNPNKLFLSTLLEEDLIAVRKAYPGATIFQLDACNGIDMDSNNMLFSLKLPDNLRLKLEADEPIIFYMNPPYRVGYGGANDIAQHMAMMGFGRSAVDIYHHFLYRICLLVDTYRLTNAHIAVFGPTGWLQSRINYEFREFIFDHFEFKGGMSFPASEFANVGDGNDWLISMSVWSVRKEPVVNRQYPPTVFDACKKDANGIPTVVGKQLVACASERLHDWCMPQDIVPYEMYPTQTSGFNFGNTLQKAPNNSLMYMLSENTVIDGVRRCAILTFNHTNAIAITPENFWRCVVSFGARSATDDQDAFLGRQVFSAPNTDVDGWDVFEADCLALVLFGMNSYAYSYRDVEICGRLWNANNNFFPFSLDECRKVITDPLLLKDMEEHPANNELMVKAIAEKAPIMSQEAKDLMVLGYNLLGASLMGTTRQNCGYKNWTNAYDASLSQIRTVPELFTEDNLQELRIKTSKLRSIIKPSVMKYGMLIDKEGINSAK